MFLKKTFNLAFFYLCVPLFLVGLAQVYPMRSGYTQSTKRPLLELTIPEIQAAYSTGELTAVELVRLYLTRIDRVDRQGPSLNAVRYIHSRVLSQAARLDAEYKIHGPRGPLHGIPILLKDNIDTSDMETTAGSLALAGSFPPKDAFIVEKLREAGAIIMGKTNLSEFANFIAFGMPSGYSSYGGQVLMPYDLDVNPSGSSSGSAVAAAANLATITIGTETSGSIISPATTNSVVGIKPTVGLWSRSGIIPISVTQDTAGPITRTVTDAAILLGTLTGVDPRDSATEASRNRALDDYTRFLDKDGLSGATICVVRETFPENPEALAIMEDALKVMADLGAQLIDSVSVPFFIPGPSLLEREFKTGLNDYLEALGEDAPVKSLSEIIEFNRRNTDRVKYGQAILEASEATLGILDPDYEVDREQSLRENRDVLDAALTDNNCSALLFSDNRGVVTSARAGYPSITVPAGYLASNKRPHGLMFVGTQWDEGTIIKYAYAYEQASLARQTPEDINPTAYECSKRKFGTSALRGGRLLPACPPQ